MATWKITLHKTIFKCMFKMRQRETFRKQKYLNVSILKVQILRIKRQISCTTSEII